MKTEANQVSELSLAVRMAIIAMEDASWDIGQWLRIARRQREEMSTNSPLCPTQHGIDVSVRRQDEISKAIAMCRDAIPK
jgi:hypothetical protein